MALARMRSETRTSKRILIYTAQNGNNGAIIADITKAVKIALCPKCKVSQKSSAGF